MTGPNETFSGVGHMTKIAIVYFSGYGHTHKQAEAVFAGADSVDGADAKLFRINENGDLGEGEFEALAGYDAIIYGSPTYMGGAGLAV